MHSVKTYLLPKTSTAYCHSHDLSPRIHSTGEKFWELSLDVGDKGDLFSFVSKECCLLDSLYIANCQTNLKRNRTVDD